MSADKDLVSVQQARDLVEAAFEAWKTVAKFDQIGDFRPDEGDKIDLSHIDAISGTAANDAFTMVNAFISQAGQLFQTKVDGGWLLRGDINGDNTADFAIQVDSTVKLSNSDIWM